MKDNLYIMTEENILIKFNLKTFELQNEIELGEFGLTSLYFHNEILFFSDVYGGINRVHLEKFQNKRDKIKRNKNNDSWILSIKGNQEFVFCGRENGNLEVWDHQLNF